MENRINTNEDVIFEETRERETKQLNIIMHGVQECDDRSANGEKSMEWDRKEI